MSFRAGCGKHAGKNGDGREQGFGLRGGVAGMAGDDVQVWFCVCGSGFGIWVNGVRLTGQRKCLFGHRPSSRNG